MSHIIMETKERLWGLLAKKFSGEATIRELRELQEILEADTEFEEIEHILFALWKPDHPSKQQTSEAFIRLLARLADKENNCEDDDDDDEIADTDRTDINSD